jgi:hypothetical protein
MHGLYVFRVIQDFFSEPGVVANLPADERRYLARRVDQIDGEVSDIGEFASSADLTTAGRALAKRLQLGKPRLNSKS